STKTARKTASPHLKRSTVLCAEGKGEWREVKALDPRNAVSVDLAGVRPGYLPKTGVEQQFAKVPSSGGRTLGRCLSNASHPESGKQGKVRTVTKTN
ncbi:hypothetical protein PIB30_103920, partial [Stylosanthes scabra]|nr:hypothetical protein [Stylosanthes scabra]